MAEKYRESVDIWGIKVPVGARGRRVWPEKLKNLACYKILHEKRTIKSIADELGAIEGVVARWVKASRGAQETLTEPKTFVEVQARDGNENAASQRILATLTFNGIDICFHHPLDAKVLSETALYLAGEK